MCTFHCVDANNFCRFKAYVEKFYFYCYHMARAQLVLEVLKLVFEQKGLFITCLEGLIIRKIRLRK
jgi:hypothetical protein